MDRENEDCGPHQPIISLLLFFFNYYLFFFYPNLQDQPYLIDIFHTRCQSWHAAAMSSSKCFCAFFGFCRMKLKPEDLKVIRTFRNHCLIRMRGYYTDFAGETRTQQIYWWCSLSDLISFFTNTHHSTRTFLIEPFFPPNFPWNLISGDRIHCK